ncbi:MAG: SDR family NAD(P)-dependent oxidoreductase [Propionibacteriaceae bacterium]|nr:SDR family NAD(P)-dependent oxidoreductase [Propionibacteriaceae bacterium]
MPGQFCDRYGPYGLVAGGSDGLGAAFAESLAKRGLNLVLVARQTQRLESTGARLRQAYRVDVKTIAADLADFEAVKSAVECLDVSIGLLVYNAAYCPIGLFETKTEEELALATAVNVRTPLLIAHLLSEPMIARGRGGIVLMSSLAGAQGSQRLATYAATKAFNATLAEGLWKELKPRGVDVVACVAGAIMTPGYSQAESAKPAPGTLAPQAVAEQTLRALGKGPIVVPGAVNKVGRFVLTRLLSRRAAIAMMANNTGGLV